MVAPRVDGPLSEAESLLLSAARTEMYDALKLFHTHVKYTMSLMLSILTSVFVVFGFVLREMTIVTPYLAIFKLTGATILFLMTPIGVISAIITGRYYRLYVAALVFAAEVHAKYGVTYHYWLGGEMKIVQAEGKQRTRLIRVRTYGWPHSWILYTILVGLITLASLVIGIRVLVSL